jgi:hypothetical protein
MHKMQLKSTLADDDILLLDNSSDHEKIKGILREHFGVEHVPCYYWMTCLLKIIKPASFSARFSQWVQENLREKLAGKTLSLDGKTVRSTEKMDKYTNSLHIISAQVAELGITFGQTAVRDKSNEIPAVQELIGLLDVQDMTIVADALNCQKDTAKTVIKKKADYILSVKDNQKTLKKALRITCRTSSFAAQWTRRKPLKNKAVVSKSAQHSRPRTLIGWKKNRTGPAFVASARYIRNSQQKPEHLTSGITTFPAKI